MYVIFFLSGQWKKKNFWENQDLFSCLAHVFCFYLQDGWIYIYVILTWTLREIPSNKMGSK